jgi:NAD(P)-dependent dehydrogenase (short-subunit alcohol dehydrogenase family)
VLISGGCGDVGRAIGKKMSEDGFDVVALYHTASREEAEAILHTFVPGNHEALKCDIREGKAVADLIAHVEKNHGAIDVCVHTAVDPILRKNLLDMTTDEFEGQFGTGVFGGFHLLTQVGRVMYARRKGAIIGILSRVIHSDSLHSRMAGYVAAKCALRGILKELCRELSPSGITVNALAPDFMDTKLNGDLPAAVRKFVVEHAVTGSMRTPEDVASAVSFLCSEKGSIVNGKIFSPDGKETNSL